MNQTIGGTKQIFLEAYRMGTESVATSRREILAAKIIGLQEAMRPLLEEWSKLKDAP
jgi:hypothetical protein